MSLENQSWQRHVQLRSQLGLCVELAKTRHVERYPRRLIREAIEKIILCLDDIDLYENEDNKESGIT